MALCSDCAFAYWPPLRDVQAWMTTAGSQTTVYYKVFDPKLNAWQQSSWTALNKTVYGLTVQDGIVAWGCYYGSASSYYDIYYRVYDPAAASWKGGNWTKQVGSTFSLTVKDGVVAWGCYYGAPSTGYTYDINYASYDPVAASWKMDGWSQKVSSVYSLVADDGVAAWAYYYGSSSTGYHYAVDYAIYDPAVSSWKEGSWSAGSSSSTITIQDAAVRWTAGASNYTRGYNHTMRAWYDGPTLPCALFAASPAAGSPPMAVWFTDMSIGASAWNWTFADGSTSTERSPFHTFSTYGAFTVSQSVTGPDGSHSASQTITTDSVLPAGSVIINSDAACTDVLTVDLALSATDNSGVVTSMRFRNDDAAWGEWESFAAARAWTLDPVDGTRTVSVQFKDAAQNISAACSDTIVLDTSVLTVTVDQAADQPDPVNTSPVKFTVEFSQPVADFTTEDVVLSGNAGALLASVSGGPAIYHVDVTGMTAAGAVIASVPAGAAHNINGRVSQPSTTADDRVYFYTGLLADLDDDPGVNLSDFAQLAALWMRSDCGLPNAFCSNTDLNLDGTVAIEDLLLIGEHWYDGLRRADLDGNGFTDFGDFAAFAAEWSQTGCATPDWCAAADLDRSGIVDISDLAILSEQWLEPND